jgi:phage terminase large subunit-like protein
MMTAAPHNTDRQLRHRKGTAPQRQFWRSEAAYRLFVGGVGSGKTRAGCVEVLRQPAKSIGMVLAPTYVMLRDATMRTFLSLANRGGIVAQLHRADMTVELTDGKVVLFRSADNPDRLRGPNLGWFYLDEAAMMPPEVWLIMLGRLRLAPGRAWATSTPRGNTWLAQRFQSSPDYAIVRSSSRQNPYLPAGFVASLEQSYSERQLRQEVEGEFLDDVPGALWTRATLDAARVSQVPDLARVVVGVDPSATSGGDACGIVVAGKDAAGHGYILDDRTIQGSPRTWALEAVAAYHRHHADRIVAESNQGGEMVTLTIKTIDAAPPVSLVHASRGKITRAEPVAAQYEKGRVHHVGNFRQLEDELCSYDGTGTSPNRLDAMVYALTELRLAGGIGVY